MRRSRIAGMGYFVPDKVVTNFDLEKMMDTSNEWIVERTGIRERRQVEPGVGASDLAKEASLKAIADAGLTPEDIDFIIFATLSPDHFFPGSSAFLQPKLGLKDIGCLDIRNQCTGFIYGLSIADQFIKSGMYKNILLIGAETHTPGLDFTTRGRDIAVLFGDGAGAVVITASDDDTGVLSTALHADGRFAEELWASTPDMTQHPFVTHENIDAGKVFPYMNGKTVFKHAVSKFPKVILETLEIAGKKIEDVDLVVPHQANQRITEAIRHRLKLTEDKVASNIHKYGNTTAASIPIAMCEARDEGRIGPGKLVSLAAFGSGFTWAGAIIQF